MQKKNKQVILIGPMEGLPTIDDFRVEESPTPNPVDGEILIRHIYLSLDPDQRGAIAGRALSAG